jgi:hypothetical protein
MSGCAYASMVLLSFQYGCAVLESTGQSQWKDERLTNTGVVDQNVNSSIEELCSLLDFFPYAIYTSVVGQMQGQRILLLNVSQITD